MINVRWRNSRCISIEAICSNWIGRVWDHCFLAELLRRPFAGLILTTNNGDFSDYTTGWLLLFYPEQMHAREVKECELCCFLVTWTKTVSLACSGDDSPAIALIFSWEREE